MTQSTDARSTRRHAGLLAVAAALAVCLVAGGAFLGFRNGLFQHTSDDPLPDASNHPIPAFVSSIDADGDGVDDQTDVLQSAEAYLATRPKYKSVYYGETGYPTDGFGVCTDVVAFALKGAGYDLMALLDADVRAHPEAYGIDEPDAAIDFRRASNQKVFFDRNAISLTLDTADPTAWQGGDIIMYDNHVAIASSRRNEKGLPYLLHHHNPLQERYEEDALESWGTVIGHYRMSE